MFFKLCMRMCINMHIRTFLFLYRNIFSAVLKKRRPYTYIYHIYPILKMPSNGISALIAGKVKVPVSRRFGTKNSNLKYHFLDDPLFWLPCVVFGVWVNFKVPISRSAVHKNGNLSEKRTEKKSAQIRSQ